MKKFLIGCLGVIVVLSIAGGIAGYQFIYKPGKALLANIEKLDQISALDNQVANKNSFSAPADNVLSAQQVERYMTVQKTMKDSLELDFNTLNDKYENIQDEPSIKDIRKLIGAYSDLIRVILEAKQSQVDALNANGFSLDEYAWVKKQIFAAAGQTLTSFDLTKIQDGGASPTEIVLPQNIPEQNLQLLEPYKDNFEDYIGLAFFGL